MTHFNADALVVVCLPAMTYSLTDDQGHAWLSDHMGSSPAAFTINFGCHHAYLLPVFRADTTAPCSTSTFKMVNALFFPTGTIWFECGWFSNCHPDENFPPDFSLHGCTDAAK